jgi:hypothetical protein
MNPRQALSEWLDQRAAKVPAKPAEPPRPAPPVEERAPVAHIAEPEPELPPVAAPPAPEPAIVVHAPAVEPAPAPADDIREVLRRAIAKRNVPAPVVRPLPVAAPVLAAVPPPVAEAAPAPAPRPAPAPAAVPAQAKPVSLFLSTRKMDTLLEDGPAEPAPQAPRIVREREVAEAPVENLAAAEPRFEIIDGAGSSSNSLEVVLPAGMHDTTVLDRAISTGKPFRGLVVSVGVNDIEGRSTRNTDLMQSIGFFVRGLLEAGEFACRTDEAEFLIICPGLEGSDAQRRLNRIAEQLWDYQLRGVSTWSILFSWGGADAHHQRLAETIARANEQMYQTRRGRRTVSADSLRPLRKVAM